MVEENIPREATSGASALAPFAEFKSEIDKLLDTILPRDRPVALLQFPYDGNVGNHMMWVATTEYFRDHGIRVAYVAHASNFSIDDLRRVIGDGTVVFLGGVTISRLWPSHAAVKRQVAAAFPNNRLVSLPATILFADQGDRDEARGIFGAHAHVTVMARDPVSGENGRQAFPDHVRVLTVPDMALRLAPQARRPGPPAHDIIWLARDDIERGVGAPPAGVHVFDWPADMRRHMPRSYGLLRVSGVFSRLRSSRLGESVGTYANLPMAELYRRASQAVLEYGNQLLDMGKVLVTDRLHPHVLTALRGQHAVLLPDKFGKNRAVFEHYTRRLPTVHWAETPAEALDIARSLVPRWDSHSGG